MRQFNVREKEVISLIVNQQFNQTTPFGTELQDYFFNENKGAALLIHIDNYYTLFVKNGGEAVVGEFFELINLLDILKRNNLI